MLRVQTGRSVWILAVSTGRVAKRLSGPLSPRAAVVVVQEGAG
jgi:hypothetical protein